MTEDEIAAHFEAALSPAGVVIERRDAPAPLAYRATARLGDRAWTLIALPHFDRAFLDLMARNAIVALTRGLAPSAA